MGKCHVTCDVIALRKGATVPHRHQQRPDQVQKHLKHKREGKDREDYRRPATRAGNVCVCALVYVCVHVHVRMHAGTLLVGSGSEASCVFRLPCEHPVH